MTERLFEQYRIRATSVTEGSRHTACLVVSPRGRGGFPLRSAPLPLSGGEDRRTPEEAAAKALAAIEALEEDGTPVFPEGYTGFDDEPTAT